MATNNKASTPRRNGEALVMILSGKGKKQIFKDRRAHRAKDARRMRRDYQQD